MVVYLEACYFLYNFFFLYLLFNHYLCLNSLSLLLLTTSYLPTTSLSSPHQEVGGGTVVTVGVAPPNVDADGSVYDVAEISQVHSVILKPKLILD